MRKIAVGILVAVVVFYALAGGMYAAFGPDWGRQNGEAISQRVHETDWSRAGSDFADWLFGQPARH